MDRPSIPFLFTAALAAATASVAADEAPARVLAASCGGCHGTHGEGAATMPALAGVPSEHLVLQLRQFRSGERPASVMHQIARGYSDAELQRLADHYARLPRAR